MYNSCKIHPSEKEAFINLLLTIAKENETQEVINSLKDLNENLSFKNLISISEIMLNDKTQYEIYPADVFDNVNNLDNIPENLREYISSCIYEACNKYQ